MNYELGIMNVKIPMEKKIKKCYGGAYGGVG